MHQAFAAAIGLNSSFLFLATLGLVQPVAAALLHNLSTVGILSYAGIRGRSVPSPLPPATTNLEGQ
jgi:Cu2+-exporting ATPase